MTRDTCGMLIVLANWMDVDGTLNDETQARVDTAGQMFMAGNIQAMLLMGWDYRDDTSLCISDAMHTYLQAQYPVDSSRIHIDRFSRDTVGDAVFSKRNFSHLASSRKICVVTSDYHRQRTQTIFDFVYGDDWHVDVIGVDTHRGSDPAQRTEVQAAEAASTEAFRQTFAGVQAGDDKAIFQTLAKKHPFYNGTIHPAIDPTQAQ